MNYMRETLVELGIIVKSVRAGDYDARLCLFTAGGKKWYQIKGVYRPKAKLAAGIGLFTVAEFTISGTTITGINVLVAPYGLTKEINRYYLACSFADALFNLEFVEQAPQALVCAVKVYTRLATTNESCYPIFIDFYTQIYHLLGYEMAIKYQPTTLTHQQGKALVKEIIGAYLAKVDYAIQFCDMMYLNA